MAKPVSIKKLRISLGLSQAAFAEKIGIDQATVSRMENGQEPSRMVKMLLSQVFQGLKANA